MKRPVTSGSVPCPGVRFWNEAARAREPGPAAARSLASVTFCTGSLPLRNDRAPPDGTAGVTAALHHRPSVAVWVNPSNPCQQRLFIPTPTSVSRSPRPRQRTDESLGGQRRDSGSTAQTEPNQTLPRTGWPPPVNRSTEANTKVWLAGGAPPRRAESTAVGGCPGGWAGPPASPRLAVREPVGSTARGRRARAPHRLSSSREARR